MSRISRRVVLGAAGSLAPRAARAQRKGCVVGEATARRVGERVLADGGNAIDALVAAALAAGLTSPHMTGAGGYGGALILARNGGRDVHCVDFNGTAPAAQTGDAFAPGPDGIVPGNIHLRGWRAAGVPGVLAGLQLALTRFGTRSLRDVIQPTIDLARAGVVVTRETADRLQTYARYLQADPGSARLYYPEGKPPAAGERLRYPALAEMYATLAARNSADSFYTGDIAGHIVQAFQRGGGCLTREDLGDFRAREVRPLEVEWKGRRLLTAPVTSGGLTTLQALRSLRELKWDEMPPGIDRAMAALEALRHAWGDRLELLGDLPGQAEVAERLLGASTATATAQKVRAALAAGKASPGRTRSGAPGGTLSLGAVDAAGTVAALTYTHGESFGACVTVPELNLTLGHGMSRFDPRPGLPNSPGPGKRPFHNMCPTLVLEAGGRMAAVGGRGGRRIPNSLFAFLTAYVGRGTDVAGALAEPRLHTEGDLAVFVGPGWPDDLRKGLVGRGYQVADRAQAVLSAVEFDVKTGEFECGLQ